MRKPWLIVIVVVSMVCIHWTRLDLDLMYFPIGEVCNEVVRVYSLWCFIISAWRDVFTKVLQFTMKL